MDEQSSLLLYAIEIVVGIILAVYGGVLIWLVRKILGMESNHGDDRSEMRQDIAVLDKSVEDLKENWERAEQHNTDDHQSIIKKIDGHHEVVTKRLDRAITLIKNGN